MREIQLDGPGKNSLGTAMLTHLVAELREAAGEPVLLTGAGDAFSAGLDLKEIHALEGEGMLEFLRLLERAVAALFLYPGPTVALGAARTPEGSGRGHPPLVGSQGGLVARGPRSLLPSRT